MGFPVVLPLAKLGLIAAAGPSVNGLGPLVTAAMLWPFMVKFAFNFRPLKQSCWDMADSLRLFLFQMSQIAFDGEAARSGPRWQRALRLVYERLLHGRRTYSDSGEESLLALSMHAL